uniref:Replication-associated protein n=1 Tax=Capulavirus medicagonis TaxID=1306546 RepID=A0A3G3BIZ0_9GEMI|nr:RepA [Alfalfa leaf curl virus]
MPRRGSNFRIQGKSIFLTYPQCPLIPIFLIDYLFQLLKNWDPTYARVCREEHQSGEPHLHCLVQMDKKIDIKDPRFFDVKDPNGISYYHPNTQVPRRDADVADYISKGGVFEERGILRASRRSPKKSRDSIWATILTESTSKSEFLSRCRTEQPYTYATQLRNLEYMANREWPEPPTVYQPRWTHFPSVPESIKQWADENIFTVSLFAVQLTEPSISIDDLIWAQDLTADQINDAYNINTITVRHDAGPETGSPSDVDH